MDIEKIGGQIAALRKEHGYTQERLAEMLDISPQAVSKWENGRALPETALLPGLAKALETSIDTLLSDNSIRILSAYFGDGIDKCNVADRLNRLICNNILDIEVNAPVLDCPIANNRPKYLILKYQTEQGIYYAYAQESGRLLLDLGSRGYLLPEELEIIDAAYGTAKTKYNVMHKLEHYKLFNWNEYHADHEVFPSDPANDDKEYLTFVYLCREGIRLVTCEEGESIAFNADKTELLRKQAGDDCFIPNVPMPPPFGRGMECSWGAALTAALQAMGVKTAYEQVMGVSGACYRLAFCSPVWDYSSVDGLVAFDYATPGYKAFGYTPRFAERIDKDNRAAVRREIVDELRHNMPVLAINLRVAAEWGVICGCRENGADLFCRTKYDEETVDSPDFEKGKLNPYDYLYVDNWPFIITYFSGKTTPPSDKENLLNSLKVFIECAGQINHRGYATGFQAYELWRNDLLDEGWYRSNDDDQLARRFSVNQYCMLALFDARRSAYRYLSENRNILPGRADDMDRLIALFSAVSDKAGQIHAMLDSGEVLDGIKARRFWTKEMRGKQAALLDEMLQAERAATKIAEQLV